MLDQIIENIIQKIRKEVVQPGMQDIPLTYLFTRQIPDSIKHFFDQEVELWIREESEKFSSSDRFDYDLPEVQMLLDKIFDTLKQTATFNLNQFNRLLERAIKLEANYLIRPQQTLTQFLFKDSNVVTTIEVYDMLKYFDKFRYYKDALTDYFNLKYLREISQNQFQELVAAIDRQVYSRQPIQTVIHTVRSVNQFINEGRSTPETALHTSILLMVFQDRGLDDFASLIEKEVANGTDHLNLEQLEEMLSSSKTLAELHPAQPVPPPVPEAVEEVIAEPPPVEVEKIEVPETVETLPEPEEDAYDEDEEELFDAEDDDEEEVVPQPAETRHSAADQLADLVGDKMRGERLEDLQRLITARQRKRFIKRIFNKQEQQYVDFLELLNKTDSWKNASNHIDNFLYEQSLNPYSREALELSDLVYNRYFPKDISVNKGSEFRY